MNQKVEEALEAMGKWKTLPVACPPCQDHHDRETESITVLLYEVTDSWGNTLSVEQLEILKREGVVSCLVGGLIPRIEGKPCDKIDAKMFLDKKIQQAEEILGMLLVAKSWLEE